MHTMYTYSSQVITMATCSELACRHQAKQLTESLQHKDAAGAQELLSSDKSLIWTRDDDSGGYPLHIAVYHVSCHALFQHCLRSNIQTLSAQSLVCAC